MPADENDNSADPIASDDDNDTPDEDAVNTPDPNAGDNNPPPAGGEDPDPNAAPTPENTPDPNPPAAATEDNPPPAADPPAGGARRLQGMPGGGISGPKAGDKAVATKTEEPPPASDPNPPNADDPPPASNPPPASDPPAGDGGDTTPAVVYDNSYVYAPYDKIKMCAMSFERCNGAQCELDKDKNIYELRLKQYIDKNKHRFYVVDKYHKMEDGSTGFNIMEITVING